MREMKKINLDDMKETDLELKFAKINRRHKIIFQILEIVVPIIVSIPTAILTALWLKGQL